MSETNDDPIEKFYRGYDRASLEWKIADLTRDLGEHALRLLIADSIHYLPETSLGELAEQTEILHRKAVAEARAAREAVTTIFSTASDSTSRAPLSEEEIEAQVEAFRKELNGEDDEDE